MLVEKSFKIEKLAGGEAGLGPGRAVSRPCLATAENQSENLPGLGTTREKAHTGHPRQDFLVAAGMGETAQRSAATPLLRYSGAARRWPVDLKTLCQVSLLRGFIMDGVLFVS